MKKTVYHIQEKELSDLEIIYARLANSQELSDEELLRFEKILDNVTRRPKRW